MTTDSDATEPTAIFIYGPRASASTARPDSEEQVVQAARSAGTRPGRRLVWPHRPCSVRRAQTEGNLVVIGQFPALRAGSGHVEGELLEFKREHMPDILAVLDDLYGPPDDEDTVYRRTRITVTVDDATRDAWTFAYGFPAPRQLGEQQPGEGEAPQPQAVPATASERSLAVRRTATVIDAIQQLRRDHADAFEDAFRLLDRRLQPRPMKRFWGHPPAQDDRLESINDAFVRVFLSAFPDPDQDLDPLFSIGSNCRARSPQRMSRVRRLQAAAVLSVLYTAIDKEAPKHLGLRNHRLGGVPWSSRDARGQPGGRGRCYLRRPSWFGGPFICVGTFAHALDAIGLLDPEVAEAVANDPYGTPPALTGGEIKLLRALATNSKPVSGAQLALDCGIKSHRIPLNRLEAMGYASRSSRRGAWSITAEGRERAGEIGVGAKSIR